MVRSLLYISLLNRNLRLVPELYLLDRVLRVKVVILVPGGFLLLDWLLREFVIEAQL